MTEKQMYKILNEFANTHSVAVGGKLKVEIDHGGSRITPKTCLSMKYEDVIFLSDTIRGAQQFCYYLMRNKFDIVRRKNARG